VPAPATHVPLHEYPVSQTAVPLHALPPASWQTLPVGSQPSPVTHAGELGAAVPHVVPYASRHVFVAVSQERPVPQSVVPLPCGHAAPYPPWHTPPVHDSPLAQQSVPLQPGVTAHEDPSPSRQVLVALSHVSPVTQSVVPDPAGHGEP